MSWEGVALLLGSMGTFVAAWLGHRATNRTTDSTTHVQIEGLTLERDKQYDVRMNALIEDLQAQIADLRGELATLKADFARVSENERKHLIYATMKGIWPPDPELWERL